MPFRPSCIICCSDCDTDGLFTSCQHFLCCRCAARYPPGQCPRCRKPCKAVKAGAALPKEVRERVAQDPPRLLAAAAQALDFQRRQEQQTLQRLREIVTTLNQSNRGMAAQLSAACAERDSLRAAVQRLQSQPPPLRPPEPPAAVAGAGAFAPAFLSAPQRSASPHAAWLSPAAGGAATPLGWSHAKRPRDDAPHTPSHAAAQHSDAAGEGHAARFRLATPAITLRNAATGSRDATPVHVRAAVAMAPRPLQSLLCRAP